MLGRPHAKTKWIAAQLVDVPQEVLDADDENSGSASTSTDDSEAMIFSTRVEERSWFCLQTAWSIPRNLSVDNFPTKQAEQPQPAQSAASGAGSSPDAEMEAAPDASGPPAAEAHSDEGPGNGVGVSSSISDGKATEESLGQGAVQDGGAGTGDAVDTVTVPPLASSSAATVSAVEAATARAEADPLVLVPVNIRIPRGKVSVLGRRALTLLGFCPPPDAPAAPSAANGALAGDALGGAGNAVSPANDPAAVSAFGNVERSIDGAAALSGSGAAPALKNSAALTKIKVSRKQVNIWPVSRDSVIVHNTGGPIWCIRGGAFRDQMDKHADDTILSVPPLPKDQVGDDAIPRIPRAFVPTAGSSDDAVVEGRDWLRLRRGEACKLHEGDFFTLARDAFPVRVLRDETFGSVDLQAAGNLRDYLGKRVSVFRRELDKGNGGWCSATIQDTDPICSSFRLKYGDGVTEWRLRAHVSGLQNAASDQAMTFSSGARKAQQRSRDDLTTDVIFDTNKRLPESDLGSRRRSQRPRGSTMYATEFSDTEGDDFSITFRPAMRDPPVRIERPELELFWKNEKPPTYYFYHPICLQHLVPPGHIELPDRLETIVDTLRELRDTYPMQLQACDDFKRLTREDLQRVHPEWYLYRLQHMVDQVEEGSCSFVPHMSKRRRAECARQFALATSGPIGVGTDGANGDRAKTPPAMDLQEEDSLDQSDDYHDTFVSALSLEAAEVAVSACAGAIDAVVGGRARNAFCAVRPPGHHCGSQGPGMSAVTQGFCLMNNVVLAAEYARDRYHGNHPGAINKIAIVDFDVHHGNGSEEILAGREGFLFCSIHVGDLYPHTGSGPGSAPNIINVPLPRKCQPLLFQQKFEEHVVMAIERYQPDLLLVSAGFDGHAKDPTDAMMLQEKDYEVMTGKLKRLADAYCDGRMVSVLEGGYSLEFLKRCVARHVLEMMRK